MKVIVTKPAKGLVDIRLDDSRGFTGIRKRLKAVKIGNLAEVLGPELETWEEERKAIRSTRRSR